MSTTKKLSCPYCGSEIEWRGEAVLTCQYCGTAFSKQGSVGDHLMESVNYDAGEVFRLFTQWALRMPETPNDFATSATLARCRLEFHPYWLYEISGVFSYAARGKPSFALAPLFTTVPESFAEEQGAELATVVISLPALRRDSESILSRLKLSLAGKVYFSYRYVQQRGGVLLDPDIPPEEADQAAVVEAEREIARKLSRRLGEHTAVKLVERKTFERKLVHVPVYICEYAYGPRRHMFVADAGSSRIIYAEVPKEAKFRAAAAFAGAAAITAAVLTFLLAFTRAPFFALTTSLSLLTSGGYSIVKALSSTVTVREFYAQ